MNLLERLQEMHADCQELSGFETSTLWGDAADEIGRLRTALQKIATGKGTGCTEAENATIMRGIAREALGELPTKNSFPMDPHEEDTAVDRLARDVSDHEVRPLVTPAKLECPDCHGNGAYWFTHSQQREECRRCLGTGFVCCAKNR